MSARHGILDDMLNLRCESGHRAFSPEPELWIGRECGAVIDVTVEPGSTTHSKHCHALVKRYPTRAGNAPRGRRNDAG